MKKSIEENVRRIRDRIENACVRAGREPGSVRLLAATKYRTPLEIEQVIAAGVDLLGENRVQELRTKQAEVVGDAEWHFIGHLQRNKCKYLVGVVSLVHSVDSVPLALELDRRTAASGGRMDVLLQVNVAAEPSKYGFAGAAVAAGLEQLANCGHVRVVGLSTMAPHTEDPQKVRWVFGGLKGLLDDLKRSGAISGTELSMGMTNDFEVAVEEGSTIVRIGTAIFDGFEIAE